MFLNQNTAVQKLGKFTACSVITYIQAVCMAYMSLLHTVVYRCAVYRCAESQSHWGRVCTGRMYRPWSLYWTV